MKGKHKKNVTRVLLWMGNSLPFFIIAFFTAQLFEIAETKTEIFLIMIAVIMSLGIYAIVSALKFIEWTLEDNHENATAAPS